MPERMMQGLAHDHQPEQPELDEGIACHHGKRGPQRPQPRNQDEGQRQEDHELKAFGPDQEVAAIAVIGKGQRQQRRRDGRRAQQQRHGEWRVIGDAAMSP